MNDLCEVQLCLLERTHPIGNSLVCDRLFPTVDFPAPFLPMITIDLCGKLAVVAIVSV